MPGGVGGKAREGHSIPIRNPTGYPWRVGPMQSPLPFHRLKENAGFYRFSQGEILFQKRFLCPFSLVTFLLEATGKEKVIDVRHWSHG